MSHCLGQAKDLRQLSGGGVCGLFIDVAQLKCLMWTVRPGDSMMEWRYSLTPTSNGFPHQSWKTNGVGSFWLSGGRTWCFIELWWDCWWICTVKSFSDDLEPDYDDRLVFVQPKGTSYTMPWKLHYWASSPKVLSISSSVLLTSFQTILFWITLRKRRSCQCKNWAVSTRLIFQSKASPAPFESSAQGAFYA